MTVQELSPQEVKDFWAFMTNKFGSEVIDKDDSDFMKMVGGFLDLIDVTDKKAFMEDFTTTIGDKIYIPFDIGVSGNYDLWDQVDVCVHEHQHVHQLHRDGPLTFSLGYISSKRYRALKEAEAYRCDMEMHYWRTGRIYSPDQLAESLNSYGVDKEDVDFVRQYLEASALSVQEGAIISYASQIAIEYAEEHWRYLKT